MRLLSNRVLLTVGTLSLIIGSAYTGPNYTITLTESMPRGIYKQTNETLHRGAIVGECLPEELGKFGKERGYLEHGKCPGEAMSILKEVVAIPRDFVELTDEYVAVNGKVILNSETRKIDSKGRELPAYPRGKFQLEPGQVFLLATNSPRSWDGRYTGPAKITDIIGFYKPVWIEAKSDF